MKQIFDSPDEFIGGLLGDDYNHYVIFGLCEHESPEDIYGVTGPCVWFLDSSAKARVNSYSWSFEDKYKLRIKKNI